MKNAMAAVIALVCLSGAAPLDEASIVLKDSTGKAQVTVNCTMCHSLDYIRQNSPFLDQKGWKATVDKMVNVMGAPIAPQDVDAIVAYLVANYGKAPVAAPSAP